MGAKILLVRPINVYHYNNYPPLGLISIGSVLKRAGYEVTIVDCAFEREPLRVIQRELKDVLFVGVSLLTSEVPHAYEVLSFIRENSNRPTVVGGWHCTLFPQQMANSPLVDYVVTGEGEEHILAIADLLAQDKRPAQKVFQQKIVELDRLPVPDYGIDRNIERYVCSYLTDKLSERIAQPMRWLPYESSRGCPSQCTFCINVVTGNNRYRKKSADKVVAEIDEIVRKFRLTHLKIVDDNFFADIRRTREICRGIIQRGLSITWDGECRCDYFNDHFLNDSTLALARESGLVQLTLGIESGSRHTLMLMKKGITPEQAERAVRKCDQFGIIARSSFMIEVPGETFEGIKETVRFVNRLRKYKYFTCGVGTFRPYPGCELTTNLLQAGYLVEPSSFEEWTNRSVVDLYTSAEYIRPWQVSGNYSENAAYYLNMESAVRLGNHQIDRVSDRVKNALFVNAARLRNKLLFYRITFDKALYKRFLTNFYRERQELEKSGSYPLSRQEEAV